MATIEKRGDSYRIIASVGYDTDGKQIRKRMTWTPSEGMTPRQIKKELVRVEVEFESAIKNGEYLDSKNIRLYDFCTEYLNLTKAALAPRTWSSYQSIIRQRISPVLGHIKLAELRPLHVQRFIKALEEKGQFDDLHHKQWVIRAENAKKACKTIPLEPAKKEYLSAATIKRIHAVLQSVLGRALKLGLISVNPADCEKIDLPIIEQAEVQILDKDDVESVFQALESEPLKYQVMIHMALTLGCRRGELMALRWDSIDMENGSVSIDHSAFKLTGEPVRTKGPKNKGSIRKLTLPEYCTNLLKIYRKEQNEERLKLGDQWHGDNWVFTQWDGQEMNPDTPSSWFPKFLKSHGLPHVKFHALRHSSATLLLYSGSNIKAVASRLGHTQLATTNRYLHALRPADQAAADTFNGMFGKKTEKKSELI